MNPDAFNHPEWRAGLALAIAGIALALAAARGVERGRRRRLFGSPRAHRRQSLASDVALVVAGIAIAVALAGPRIGERSLRIPATGIDVVFLIDVSRSMAARDVAPSRLDRARRAVEEIVGRLSNGDRAALAVFASRGLMLVPLTPDHAAIVELLAALDVDLIEPASSDLAGGVEAAVEAFEAGSERPRVLVVASDGEDARHRREVGLDAAHAAEARVITVAIGTEAGSFVPDGARLLVDEHGDPVRSRRDRERLAQLADGTDGDAFVGDAWGRIDFARAAEAVRRDVGQADGYIERKVAAVRIAPFAALALVLLLLEGLPRPRRPATRGPTVRTATTRAVAAVAIAVATIATPRGISADPPSGDREAELAARVRADPEDARAHLDLGLVRLAAGSHEAAVRAFQAATVFANGGSLAAVAWYDLGVARLASGDLEVAREAFFEALVLDPSDEHARFNLEWTLQNRSEPPDPPDRNPMAREDAADGAEREGAETGDSPAADDSEIPKLNAVERARWLARAEDDPSRWLRAAAGHPDENGPRVRRPAW